MTERHLEKQLGLKYPPQVDSLENVGAWPQSAGFKFEFPKSEIRNKFKRPKIQNPRRQSSLLGVWEIRRCFLSFGFGICFGFRVSDFGLLCPTGGVQQ